MEEPFKNGFTHSRKYNIHLFSSLMSLKFIEQGILHKGSVFVCTEAKDSESGKIVVIKKANRVQDPVINMLNNELQSIIKLCDIEGIRKNINDKVNADKPELILEFINGKTLATLIESSSLTIELFFNVAIATTQILEQAHNKGYIHRKLCSQHIIIDNKDSKPVIINLSACLFLGTQGKVFASTENLEAVHTHMAPEQTGRTRLQLDYRTDIYSLGIIFYEMLTGLLPFAENTFANLVHCHLAREPKPVHDINFKVPRQVSEIIKKMMQKDPNARYQSMYGVLCDIQKCAKQWKTNSTVEIFELATSDFSNYLVIPDKLYGRSNEEFSIRASFDNMMEGHRTAVLLSGQPGVGKTALVHHLRQSISSVQGFFIE